MVIYALQFEFTLFFFPLCLLLEGNEVYLPVLSTASSYIVMLIKPFPVIVSSCGLSDRPLIYIINRFCHLQESIISNCELLIQEDEMAVHFSKY